MQTITITTLMMPDCHKMRFVHQLRALQPMMNVHTLSVAYKQLTQTAAINK